MTALAATDALEGSAEAAATKAAARLARQPGRGVVLLGAVDAIGPGFINRDPVDLRGRLVALVRPALAAVEGDVGAAVIGVDHHLRVVRVDPQIVVVAVRRAQPDVEGLAAVDRLVEAGVERVDGVLVLRVGVDVDVVPGALQQVAAAVHPTPVVATVIGAEHATLVVRSLHQDPHALAVGGRDRYGAAADHAFRQTAAELVPGGAAILAAVDAVVLGARVDAPGVAARRPCGGQQDARVAGIDLDVDEAGVVVDVEDLLPAVATIGGLVDAAIFVVAEDVAEHCGPGGVVVAGVHDHLADVGLEIENLVPALTGVRRAVDAVADGHVAARTCFTAAHIEDVAVRGSDGDGADGADAEEAVGDVLPAVAGVGRLPHAAAGAAEVVSERIIRDAGDRRRASATGEVQRTELHVLVETFIDRDVGVVAFFLGDDGGRLAGQERDRADQHECEQTAGAQRSHR